MMEQQLLQLPGGDWIDPEMVAMVVGLKSGSNESSRLSDSSGKVVIALRNGMVINEFPELGQRISDLRDRVANEINSAVYPFSVQ